MENNPEINNKGQEFQDIIKVKKDTLSSKQERQYEDAYQKYLELKKLNIDKEESEKRISEAIKGKKNIDDILKAFNEEVDKIIEETSGLVDKLQGEVEKGVKDLKGKMAEEAEEAKDKMQDKAVEEGLGFIEKRIPGAKTFYKYFKKIGKAFEKVKESSSKGFVATIGAIIGAIGVMFGKGEWWGKKGKEEGIIENNGEKDIKEEKTDGEENEAEEKLSFENKESLYSKTGFNIIKFFGIIDLETGSQYIFQKIKKYKYEELRDKYLRATKDGTKTISFDGLNNTSENYKVLHTLFHDYSITLYETKLSSENLKKIVASKKITEIIGEDGLKEIKESNYDFTKLSFNLISKLVSLSFKGMFMASLYMLKEKVSGVYDYITSNNKLLSKVKDDVEERREKLFSKNSFNVIKGKSTGTDFGGQARVRLSKEKLLEGFEEGKDYNKADERQLDSFLTFRNKIVNLVHNEKYTFNIPGFLESFNSGIDLGKIYILYLLLDGKDLSEIDSFEKGSLYLWIYEVLKKKDGEKDVSGKYKGELLKQINEENSKFFTENDKKVLKLLSYRVLKVVVDKNKAKIKQNIDFVNTFFEKYLPDSLDNETKENILKGAEVLIAILLGGYVVFGKKNIALRIFIATSGILGYMALFVAGGSLYKGLEGSIREEDKKRIDNMLNEMLQSNPVNLNIKGKDGKTSTVKIDNLEDAEKITNGTSPQEFNEQKLQGETIYLGNNGQLHNLEDINDRLEKSQETPVFVDSKNGFHVIYKGRKFIFDTQTNIFSSYVDNKIGKSSDKFKGYELMYNNIHMDTEKGIIEFSGTEYSLEIKDVVNIMKKGELKSNFTATIHYYEIDKDRSDSLVLLYKII